MATKTVDSIERVPDREGVPAHNKLVYSATVSGNSLPVTVAENSGAAAVLSETHLGDIMAGRRETDVKTWLDGLIAAAVKTMVRVEGNVVVLT
jgi:hypothetical protein